MRRLAHPQSAIQVRARRDHADCARTLRGRAARRHSLTSSGEYSLDVFGQNVELDIHRIAGSSAIKISMALRVWDDPYDETLWKRFSDRQADTVESDRTLGHHILRKLSQQLDFQAKIRAFLLERNNARHAIDVALHKVSTQASFGGQGTLQIHCIVAPQIF